MSDRQLRVAYFPDTFDEVDGVAHTSRQFQAFARRHERPLLIVHGAEKASARVEGSTERLTLRRGPIGFPLDKHHRFDLAFHRYYRKIEARVRAFDADIVHITGPSDAGLLGLAIAHFNRIPLAASWHTNLHLYADQRSAGLLKVLPHAMRERVSDAIRRGSLEALLRLYGLAQVSFAPNDELQKMLESHTGKPCLPMVRGVDRELFHPAKRNRKDDVLTIGFVGRLSPEKNLHDLAEVEARLIAAGVHKFRFLIVGQGPEQTWLRATLRHAEFAGVLRGEALSEAFANMDILAFPSRTETFGNVVLEAMASGVPAVVSSCGGPRFLVKQGVTGFIGSDVNTFSDAVVKLATAPTLRRQMSLAAREGTAHASWDRVFEDVYAGYEHGFRVAKTLGKKLPRRSQANVAVGNPG